MEVPAHRHCAHSTIYYGHFPAYGTFVCKVDLGTHASATAAALLSLVTVAALPSKRFVAVALAHPQDKTHLIFIVGFHSPWQMTTTKSTPPNLRIISLRHRNAAKSTKISLLTPGPFCFLLK